MSRVIRIKPKIATTFILLISALPLMIAATQYSKISLESFSLTAKLYSHILDSVAANSLITCYSDRSCFSLIYEQTVNDRRSDVQVVPLSNSIVHNKLNASTLSHFSYDKNPWLLFDIVSWNIGKRPVYAVDFSQSYYALFGMTQGYMFYIPQGYYGELTREMPTTIPTYDASITEDVLKSSINPNDYMQRVLIQSLEQSHYTNGTVFLLMGSRDAARNEVNHAVNLAYLLTPEDRLIAHANRTKIEKMMPNPAFYPGKRVPTPESLLTMIPSLYTQNKYSQALKVIQGAVSIDPASVVARLELARYYTKTGDKYMAWKEYLNVLILDPKNKEATDQLAKMNQ